MSFNLGRRNLRETAGAAGHGIVVGGTAGELLLDRAVGAGDRGQARWVAAGYR